MSEEIYCAKCNNLTEEILLLSCDHNLCILCAAENISKQESRGVISHYREKSICWFFGCR